VGGSPALTETSVRRDPGTVRLTQIALLIAGAGALVMVFNIFGIAIVGLVMIVIGALLASRGGVGHRWYTALVIGAALAVLSRIVAEGAETLGGWLAVIATLVVLVGVSLGYPTGGDEPT
jgi:hypothetical protein